MNRTEFLELPLIQTESGVTCRGRLGPLAPVPPGTRVKTATGKRGELLGWVTGEVSRMGVETDVALDPVGHFSEVIPLARWPDGSVGPVACESFRIVPDYMQVAARRPAR